MGERERALAASVRASMAENARLRDLLARVLASFEDGTVEIPDVARAMEAEIKETLNG